MGGVRVWPQEKQTSASGSFSVEQAGHVMGNDTEDTPGSPAATRHAYTTDRAPSGRFPRPTAPGPRALLLGPPLRDEGLLLPALALEPGLRRGRGHGHAPGARRARHLLPRPARLSFHPGQLSAGLPAPGLAAVRALRPVRLRGAPRLDRRHARPPGGPPGAARPPDRRPGRVDGADPALPRTLVRADLGPPRAHRHAGPPLLPRRNARLPARRGGDGCPTLPGLRAVLARLLHAAERAPRPRRRPRRSLPARPARGRARSRRLRGTAPRPLRPARGRDLGTGLPAPLPLRGL